MRTAVLEDLLAQIQRRDMRGQDLPAAVANAYPQMVVAASFARLGEHDRAKAIFVDARKPLDGSDPVHAFLIAAFGGFIDEIVSGAPARDFLVEPHRAKLATLERVASYKAARMLNALTTDDASVDPMASFSRRESVYIQDRPWKRLPNVVRAAKAELALEGDVNECVEILRTLDETHALPILVRLKNRPATTIEIAGKFGWGELVPDALAKLLALHREFIQRAFPKTLRALRRLGLRDEIVQLISAADVTSDPKLHLLAAGVWAWLGDPRAERVFNEAYEAQSKLNAVDKVVPKMDLIRAIASGYTLAPLAFALAGARRLARLVPHTHDRMGTESHFFISLVHLTASICLIVEDAIGDPA